MKITKLELPVMSSWTEENGRRLDCNPYLSGAFEAKVILEKLPVKKEPLHHQTSGHNGGIYNGPFVVLLQIFSEATHDGQTFNKFVVFDEAHKYIESPDLVAGLIEVVREMRHKGTSIMVASQDPPSVPTSLIELSSHIIMHRFNSPAWLKHIQKANVSLNSLTPENMSNLSAGEAYVWSSKASDDAFTRGAMKVRCRPRVTQHGGSTKTAVDHSV